MDPTPVIGALIGLATQASDALHYISSFENAPREIQTARNDVANHLSLFLSVQRLLVHKEELAVHFADGAFEAAMQAMKELLDLIGGDFTNHLPGIVSTWRNITWTINEKNRLREIRGELERQKAFIRLSLNTALLDIMTAEIDDTKGRAEITMGAMIELNKKLDHMEKTSILNHCLPRNDDMSALHSERKALQEPETCDWIFREKSLKDWLQRDHIGHVRYIWVHGIPGAGKTVLASSIIERAASNCNSCGYAYYYCLYSRRQDETIPFLKYILRLLCKQKQTMVLPKLHEAYAREEALSVEDLLNCLEEISLAHDKGIHIIIDAVDESNPREGLLQVLGRIGTEPRFRKVSLLFTSREENDISKHIKEQNNAVACISMSNINVRDDIKRYIHAQLTESGVFKMWYDSDLITEVEKHLTSQAKGMFRWAVCQLDVLKRTRGRENVLRALHTLPGDIFATYERILSEIPQAEQEFVRTALALICSETAGITTAEVLVKASVWNVPFNDIDKYTVAALKESCGSLISLTTLSRAPRSRFVRGDETTETFHRCSLAHYTVKEYLFSPNVASGPAQFFALSDQVVGNIDLKVMFASLSHLGRYNTHQVGRRQFIVSRYEERCLEMTEYALKHRRADIIRDENIWKMVIKSLTPRSQHFKYVNEALRHRVKTIIRDSFPLWHMLCSWDPAFHDNSTSGLLTTTGLLVNLTALDWRELAVKYLESAKFRDLSREQKTRIWTKTFTLDDKTTETILGYCLRVRQLKFLRVFVRYGASFQYEPEVLYTAMRTFNDNPDKALEALKFLFSAGAQPNPVPSIPRSEVHQAISGGFAFTPLQLAVSELAYDWVELLLDEGADVNQVGTSDGTIPSSFDDTNPKRDEILALREIGQQTVLDICSFTQPSWIPQSLSDVNKIRESIRALLKRYGAEESHEGDEDEAMIDVSRNRDEGDSGLIDLTMD
ncbi:hypothetical protein FHL15_004221 [Xylaria flabelliformis]|uniref:Nephrocystin 3-like N-terminal domain-containing protein n=1 Tax=Xylaria flabelliformis TaxID=2512241 RepID=A0A553I3I5_9PEZI|nr:hypothetical protein FHL15_004221 [Xylaria flabelliformis]